MFGYLEVLLFLLQFIQVAALMGINRKRFGLVVVDRV